MKKIILLLVLSVSLGASHLGRRGVELAGLEECAPKRQELTECPFGVTGIIFATSGESAGILPEEMTDQASIERLCEVSVLIKNACKFAREQKNNEIEISDFPKHLFETLLEIDRNTNQVESILQSKDYDATNVSELLFLCYYFKVNSEAVKAIATYIANHENLFLAYLNFIKDLPNQDLLEYLISNLKLTERFFPGTFHIYSEVFASPDNRYILTPDANRKYNLAIISLDSFTIKYIPGNFVDFEFKVISDDKYFIAGRDKSLIINSNSLEIIREFLNYLDRIVTSKYLILRKLDKLLVINLETFEEKEILGSFEDIAISPDNKYLVATHKSDQSDDDEIVIDKLLVIDLDSYSVREREGDYFSPVLTNKYLIVPKSDTLLYVIDLETLDIVSQKNGDYSQRKKEVFEDRYLVITDPKAITEIIDLHTLDYKRDNHTYSKTFLTTGRQLILSELENNIYFGVVNLDDFGLNRNIKNFEDSDSSWYFLTSNDKYLIAIRIDDNCNKNLVIIDAKSLQIKKEFPGDYSALDSDFKYYAIVTPDGKHLIVNSEFQGVYSLFIIDLERMEIEKQILGKYSNLVLSRGGKYLMAVQGPNIVEIDLNDFSQKSIGAVPSDVEATNYLASSFIFRSPSGITTSNWLAELFKYIRDNYKNKDVFTLKLINEILELSIKYPHLFNDKKLLNDIRKYYNLT